MAEGVVQRHNEKHWNGKTFYSFALSGQDGWYNSGVKRPPAVGTSVRFTEKKNSKGYLEVDGSIEVLNDGETKSTSSLGSVIRAAAATGGGQSAYWDRKEARDITNDAARELGASRNTALSIIDLALKYEVVKLPAAAKREEFLWNLLDKYTKRLMSGDDEQETVQERKEPETTNEAVNTDEGEWN